MFRRAASQESPDSRGLGLARCPTPPGIGRRLSLAFSVAAVVVWDFNCCSLGMYWHWARFAIVPVCLCGLVILRPDVSLGGILLLPPREEKRTWLYRIAILVVAYPSVKCVLTACLGESLREGTTPIDTTRLLYDLGRALVVAPIFEETVYRVFLGECLAPAVGRWVTIVASAAAFGVLHMLYGNYTHITAVAGGVLMWAYLRSGSALVPVVLHCAWNATTVGFALALGP